MHFNKKDIKQSKQHLPFSKLKSNYTITQAFTFQGIKHVRILLLLGMHLDPNNLSVSVYVYSKSHYQLQQLHI